MTGLRASDATPLSPVDDDYVRQSVTDILTTPIGSRVMRRDYGSFIPELIDQPMNDVTRLKILGATAMALMRWHRRSRLQSVQLAIEGHRASLRLTLVRTDLPRRHTLQSTVNLT